MIQSVLPVKMTRVQNHAARGFLDPPAVLLQIDPRKKETPMETRSSWLNCALRDDEAVYWVSKVYEKVSDVPESRV